MPTIKTLVRSRGTERDYAWITSNDTAENRHPSLKALEGSNLYALSVEKQETQYHGIILINLPGMKDKVGRTIRMEIVLENLTETQARALALAYLQLPVKEGSRYWEAARKTYSPTPDGFCKVDTICLQKEIEQLIHSYEAELEYKTPEYKLHLQETSSTPGEMAENAVKHIKQFKLSTTDGIKIFLNDFTEKPEADLLLLSMLDKSTVEKKALSPKSLTPPGEKKSPAQEFALDKLEKVQKGKPIPTQDSRNLRFVIFGTVAIVLIAIIFTLCTGGKKGEGSAVQPPVPQPAPAPEPQPTPAPPASDEKTQTTPTNPKPKNTINPATDKDAAPGKANPLPPTMGTPVEQQTPATPNTVVKPNKIGNQAPVKKTPTETELPGTHPHPEHSIPSTGS